MEDSTYDAELTERLDALQREKASLESIIESIEDGFIETDLRGRITRFNAAFCQITGFPPEEADGLSYRKYMDEETALNVYKTFNKVYKTKIPNKAFDYEIIRKGGQRRNVEISITPIKDDSDKVMGFRCIMRDVTDRKKADEEIARQRSRLAAIFRSVEDAIITIDPDLNVVDANEAARKMCGMCRKNPPVNLAGPAKDTCSRACRDILNETLRSKTVIRDYQVNCRRPQAPLQKVSLSCAPLEDYNGQFLGAVLVIRDITRLSDLERELKERNKFHRLIGKSHDMQEIYQLIEDISDYEATVLITGESGTGKELVARAIHDTGHRRFKPIVTVNCSALAEPLLESELFGHVKGAFTGAIQDHIGRFQAADGGTLLLDEIGDISPLIQLKLLRVIQEKEFERVGDSTPVRVDVRIIACTHQPIMEKVRRGEFREDLYYRLNVLEIEIPPLRKRMDDLPILLDHFIARFEQKFNLTVPGITDETLQALMKYPWPGNIRELEHCIERAVILSHGMLITPRHIPPEIIGKNGAACQPGIDPAEVESQKILNALTRTDWNKAKAARLLCISRKTLYQKIRKYRLTPAAPPNPR